MGSVFVCCSLVVVVLCSSVLFFSFLLFCSFPFAIAVIVVFVVVAAAPESLAAWGFWLVWVLQHGEEEGKGEDGAGFAAGSFRNGNIALRNFSIAQ